MFGKDSRCVAGWPERKKSAGGKMMCLYFYRRFKMAIFYANKINYIYYFMCKLLYFPEDYKFFLKFSRRSVIGKARLTRTAVMLDDNTLYYVPED